MAEPGGESVHSYGTDRIVHQRGHSLVEAQAGRRAGRAHAARQASFHHWTGGDRLRPGYLSAVLRAFMHRNSARRKIALAPDSRRTELARAGGESLMEDASDRRGFLDGRFRRRLASRNFIMPELALLPGKETPQGK